MKENQNGNQYIIYFKHQKTEKTITVFIGTIDSFTRTLGTPDGGKDYFEGILRNIINNNNCNKIINNKITYAKEKITLNQKVELWIDEAQDLSIDYCKIICVLMAQTKIDAVVVGDKLQSLKHEENFMTQLQANDTSIYKYIEKPSNINRRIKVKYMAGILNEIIHFEKYNYLPISVQNEEDLEYYEGEKCVEIIEQEAIYKNDIDKQDKIDSFVDRIIELVNKTVEDWPFKEEPLMPEDFLFIFPIIKDNLIARELETRLNKYWLDKLGKNDNKFKHYAELHQHEEGMAIDTRTSEKATRIMSIMASKGDGRKIVFLLGCTEDALNIVSRCYKKDKNIVYESHINVGITRQKYKLFVGINLNKQDDFSKRFKKQIEEYQKKQSEDLVLPKIKSNFTIEQIMEYVDIEKINELISQKEKEIKMEEEENKETELFDWAYHKIRRPIYVLKIIHGILCHFLENKRFKNITKNKDKMMITSILDKLQDIEIIDKDPEDFYNIFNSLNKYEKLQELPLCNISSSPQYSQIFGQIKQICNSIQENLKSNRNNYDYYISTLNPLDSVLFYYMLDLFKNRKYHETTPSTIYKIVNDYNNDYNDYNNEHKLKDFFEKIKPEKIQENIHDIMKDISDNSKNQFIYWNLKKNIYFENDTDLNLYNKFEFIGWQPKNKVYYIDMVSDFSKINKNQILAKILLQQFLLQFSNDTSSVNEKKFANKPIIAYLIIFKKHTYKKLEWNIVFDANNIEILKDICKNALIKYYEQFHESIFNLLHNLKERKKEGKINGCIYKHIMKDEKTKKLQYIQQFLSRLEMDKSFRKNCLTSKKYFFTNNWIYTWKT